MGVLLILVVAIVLISMIRSTSINNSIDVHEDILHDAEYEKY
jgi:hypothetical protein